MPGRPARGLPDVDTGLQKMRVVSQRLRGPLLDQDAAAAAQSLADLSGSPTHKRKKRRRFNQSLLDIDKGYVLLCTLAFSLNEIKNTRWAVLHDVIHRLKQRPSREEFLHNNLREHLSKVEGSETSSSQTQPQERLAHPLRRIFSKDVCSAVDLAPCSAAEAMTVIVPEWPGFTDCILKIRVCQSARAQLAKCLFSIDLSFETSNLEVILQDGVRVGVPSKEVCLSSDRIRSVRAVFALDLWPQLMDDQGAMRVKRVFMEIGTETAFVNTALDLRVGLHLEQLLHAATSIEL